MNTLWIKGEAKDHRFADVVAEARRLIAAGERVHMKYTCQKCRTRWMLEQPNVFPTYQRCDDRACNHLTNVEQQGCNYTRVIQGPITLADALKRAGGK